MSKSTHQVHSYVVTITPAMAETWLTRSNYERQRPISYQHVAFLAQEMSMGHVIPGLQIYFVVKAGREYLVNGQHTLSAIVHSKKPQLHTVTKCFVKSDSEIAEIYSRHDKNKRRNIRDALRAYGLEDSIGLTQTEQSQVGAAIRVLRGNFSHRKVNVSDEESVLNIVDLASEARLYFESISGCYKAINRPLTRRATIAVALVNFRYSPFEAQTFWRQVAYCDGLRIGDPRKTLNEFLIGTGIHGGKLISGRLTSDAYQCRAIAAAWNAYQDGRTLQHIKVINESAPIRLSGSPFNGKRSDVFEVLNEPASSSSRKPVTSDLQMGSRVRDFTDGRTGIVIHSSEIFPDLVRVRFDEDKNEQMVEKKYLEVAD